VERQGQFFQSGIFTTPETQANGISVYQPRTVFNQPAPTLREADLQQQSQTPTPTSETENKTTVQARLSGMNISEIEDDPTRQTGGSQLEITGGSLTFENMSGESLTLETESEARIYRNESGGLTIQDRGSGEELSLSPGEIVSLEGDGNAKLYSGGRTMQLESASTLQARQTGATDTELVQLEQAERINVDDEAVAFTVNDDSLEFMGDGGQAIRFEAGESGSFSRGEDDKLTVTNETSGESVSFQTGQEIAVLGLGTTDFEAGTEMELSGPETLELSAGSSGKIAITRPESAPAVKIQPLKETTEPQKPLQLEVFSDPGLERLQTMQTELIQRPQEEMAAREDAQEAEDESEEETAEAEDDENIQVAENEPITAASFQEEQNVPLTAASFLNENEELIIDPLENEETEPVEISSGLEDNVEVEENETNFQDISGFSVNSEPEEQLRNTLTELYSTESSQQPQAETSALYA
jgi:hypothetical protein